MHYTANQKPMIWLLPVVTEEDVLVLPTVVPVKTVHDVHIAIVEEVVVSAVAEVENHLIAPQKGKAQVLIPVQVIIPPFIIIQKETL